MKKYVIILISLMATIAVFGQNETKQINVDVEEVQVTPPKFTGALTRLSFLMPTNQRK